MCRVRGYLFVLSSLCSLCLCGESALAIDPELNTPYQLRVVLVTAEHRMLNTPAFQSQLEGELRGQLQLALGKLAKVEVVRGHERVADIRSKGLQAALESWKQLSNIQTHFVLIDYTDGKYQVQTACHDGMTGLASTVVRRETATDRQRVGDLAAQMVRKNFGVVGTVKSFKDHEAILEIKAGGLVDSLTPWVKPGEVFALVRVQEQRAIPLEWAVLEVEEILGGGQVRCRYFCRYADDADLNPDRPGLGYRCLKLSTVKGPVHVRLVNDKTHEYLNGLRVEVSPSPDFKGKASQGVTLSNGLFDTGGRPFDHVAYVRVSAGGAKLAQFPIALVDDGVVVCRMSPTAAATRQGEIEARRDRWVRWLVEALASAGERFNQLNAETTLEEALRKGRIHHKAITADVKRLEVEQLALRDLAKENGLFLDMSTGKQLGEALAKRQDDLADYISVLDKTITENNSDEQRRLITLMQRARLLEQQAEFDKAIEAYEAALNDEAVRKLAASAEARKRYDKLKAEWEAKGDEHAKARSFLYDEWPKVAVRALPALLPDAKRSLATCKAHGDKLSPLKLSLTNIQHATALLSEMEALRGRKDSEDLRTKLKAMLQLTDDLRALQVETQRWLAK